MIYSRWEMFSSKGWGFCKETFTSWKRYVIDGHIDKYVPDSFWQNLTNYPRTYNGLYDIEKPAWEEREWAEWRKENSFYSEERITSLEIIGKAIEVYANSGYTLDEFLKTDWGEKLTNYNSTKNF